MKQITRKRKGGLYIYNNVEAFANSVWRKFISKKCFQYTYSNSVFINNNNFSC